MLAQSLLETQTLRQQSNLNHVAIIMDGNRRWAKSRLLPSAAGHKAGVDALTQLVRFCGEIHLHALTVYAFSTENWHRDTDEVSTLMNLFVQALAREIDALHENQVRLSFIGDLSGLPEAVSGALHAGAERTQFNTGLRFQVAINYGGRNEIIRAANKALASGQALSEETLEAHLDTAGLPPVDLLIRPGGESRISNFLLWQVAYSELWLCDTLWPEFTPSVFAEAVAAYAGRKRRFGK